MNLFFSALWAEALKARRSKVSLLTAAGFLILPVVGGLFMVIMKDPEQARTMGLIGAKAQLLEGVADWPTYFQFLSLGTAGAGAILFAFIMAWIFGREFSDRTAKELLALPTRRETIVSAKFVLAAIWMLGLAFFIFMIALGIGAIVNIPGWSLDLAWASFSSLMLAAFLSALLTPFVAFFASGGRGYLPPLGWAFLLMALSQVASAMGWGDWFPWAVPGLLSSLMGPRTEIALHSYFMILLACVIGVVATFIWWSNADQTR